MRTVAHLACRAGLKGVCSALGVMLLLSGCGDRAERVTFGGNYYPAKSSGNSQDRRAFTASVSRASNGMAGAQQAALHEATRYCLQNFGTSDIDWSGVPEGAQIPAYARAGNRVSVTGRCVIW